jgi:hypothetical protein
MTLDDIASDREEQDRALALKHRKPQLPFIGACHNCSEPLHQGAFCGAECREDFEQRERFNR